MSRLKLRFPMFFKFLATFRLRDFHDALLRYGGLPVALIRWGLGLNAA